jgi:hypothetical protein
MHVQYASSVANGARETSTSERSRWCRCTSLPSKLSIHQNEQLLQPSSQLGRQLVGRHDRERRPRQDALAPVLQRPPDRFIGDPHADPLGQVIDQALERPQ